MSNEKEGKNTPKKAEWKPNPDITMDIKKVKDDFETNTKWVMDIQETSQKKSKEQEEKK